MSKADAYFYVDDVQRLLGVSESKAYKTMQALNKELEKMGYIKVSGRIPKKFFCERFYCDLEIVEASLEGDQASGM